MAFVPIDLSSGYAPDVDIAGDGTSMLVNWRMVPPAVEGRPRINVPRPGSTAQAISGLTSPIIGAYRYQNAAQMILVTEDRYIWRVADSAPDVAVALSNAISSGTRLDGSLRPVFAEDSAGVLIAGGGYISKWSPGGAVATQITAGSAPAHATHVAVLGQRVVANNTTTPVTRGGFSWSDLGAGNDEVWDALSFATADARTDQVVAVAENTSELFVFGATSLQTYSVSSDPLSPYVPVITANVGCSAPYSVTRIDNSFLFIDDARRAVMSDGREVRDMTGNLQAELRSLARVDDGWGWRERHDRYDLWCLHFPSAQKTYELDLKTMTWSVRAKYDPAQGINIDMPIGAYCYNDRLDRHFFGRSDSSAGGFYLSSSTVDYDGASVLCERWTGYNDYGTSRRKRSAKIRAYLKTGTAMVGSTPGRIEVCVSDDDRPWTNWVAMSICNPGSGRAYADAFLGGVFVRRRVRFRYATASTESAALIGAADDVTELAT